MQKINPWWAVGAVALVACLTGGIAVADTNGNSAPRTAVAASPNQQQALDANETVRNYIQQHGDVPTPTPSDTTTVPVPPPTTSVPPTVAPPTTTPPVVNGPPSGVTVTAGNGTLTLAWGAPAAGAPTGFDYGRGGSDSTGTGAYTSPALATTVHTATLDKLTNGTAYTVFVDALYPGGNQRVTLTATPGASSPTPTVTVAPTPTPTTTPPPSVTPFLSGMPWSDGGFFEHDATQAAAFQTWRGRHVDNIEVFPARENWANMLNNWWASSVPSTFQPAKDDFIVSLPLWTNDGAAGTDQNWKDLATKIAAVDSNALVRLGWEFNCCFSVEKNAATWTAQWQRAAALMKGAAPGLKMVWNPNEGASSGGALADPTTAYPTGSVKPDIIAIDAYDWYNPYTNDANANTHYSKTYGWDYWYNFARAHNATFGLAEFSVYSGSTASGGDNPKYFDYVYHWLADRNLAVPGSIRFVSVFNDSESYCQCNLYPTTPNPKAGAEYKALLGQMAASMITRAHLGLAA